MSKYNTAVKEARTKTVNRAGGEAYKQSPKLELASVLLTSFLAGDKFYEKESATQARIVDLVANQVPIEFAMKAALYARNEFGMRSVSHLAASEIALRGSGNPRTARFLQKVVRRPDDVLEILSRHFAVHGKDKLTNGMRKGLGRALTRFDEYQVAKYRKGSAKLKLIDAVNLLHPKETPAIKKLMNGTLPAADTWETRMTQAGSSQEDKSRNWRDLVVEKRLGYMALLRNVRNILTHAPEVVTELCMQLTNVKAIEKSLVLPFRFLTAYEELQKGNLPYIQQVYSALSTACDQSVRNVPVLAGDTLVVLDVSGSMTWGGGRGPVPIKIGAFFAAVLLKAIQADCMEFAGDARYRNWNLGDSTLTIAQQIWANAPGGSTNFHAPFNRAKRPYDRIIILSDMQGWVDYSAPTTAFQNYKDRFHCDPWIYSFDLNGYGDMQFPESKVCTLAGFSDKIFQVMGMVEEDRQALVHRIEQTKI